MTFVCWGLLYGVCIMLESMGLKKIFDKVPLLSHVYLLLVAITGWVMFRADSMTYARDFICQMYTFNAGWQETVVLENNVIFAMLVGCLFSYDWRKGYIKLCCVLARKQKNNHSFFTIQKILAFVISTLLFVVSVSSVVSSSHNPFIYFRF